MSGQNVVKPQVESSTGSKLAEAAEQANLDDVGADDLKTVSERVEEMGSDNIPEGLSTGATESQIPLLGPDAAAGAVEAGEAAVEVDEVIEVIGIIILF